MGFDPLTIGIAGAVASAAGSIYSGVAASESANYQSEVANVNAQIAQQNADYAIKAGQAKVAQQGQKAADQEAQVTAALAANGVDVNTGSALNVRQGTRETGLLDTQTALNNAELQAYGYQTQKTGFQAQGALEQTQSESAIPGAAIGATGSLLNSASSLGFKWTGQQNAANGGSTTSTNGGIGSGYVAGGATGSY